MHRFKQDDLIHVFYTDPSYRPRCMTGEFLCLEQIGKEEPFTQVTVRDKISGEEKGVPLRLVDDIVPV